MDGRVTRGPAGRARTRNLVARVMALLLAVSTSGALVVLAAAPAQAQVVDFNRVFNENLHGNIQIRGNTMLTCPTVDADGNPLPDWQLCAWAQSGADEGEQVDNDFYKLTYVDVDADPTTFDSSSAAVDLPADATVLYAGLTWGGNNSQPAASLAVPGPRRSAPAAVQGDYHLADTVKLQVPGATGYVPVTAAPADFRLIDSSEPSGVYSGFADVTDMVKAAGSGSYTLADLQTSASTYMFGGWALTVAYSSPTEPLRNLVITQGLAPVGTGYTAVINVDGFLTPATGAVNTTIGVVAFEGDAGVASDSLSIGRENTDASLNLVSDALHPANNFFNSVISEGGIDCASAHPGLNPDGVCRNAAYRNQFGFDATTVKVPDSASLGHGAASAVIKMTQAGDDYYPAVVTFATNVYAPDLSAAKSVVVAKADGNLQGGVAEPGDTLQYTVKTYNAGTDVAVQTALTDAVPPGTTYRAGSLTVGGTTQPDGPDPRAISADLGIVPEGAFADPVVFDVVVDPGFYGVYGAGPIRNTARVDYRGDLALGAYGAQSNTVLTPVARHQSDLAVVKTSNGLVVQRAASTPVTYALTVTNSGLYDDPGATVTDTLPAHAVLVGAIPTQGTCTPATGTVVCALGSLDTAHPATVAVTMTLDATVDPATDTATVVGTNFDPDLTNNTSSVSTAVNTAPVAVPDSATTAVGTVTVPVLANDTDADGDALSAWSVAVAPEKGHAVINPDGTITYTAALGAVGIDTFDYVVHDSRGGSAAATVTITIPNSPPVAVGDAVAALPGQPVTVAVLGNDTDVNIDLDPHPDLTLPPRPDSGQSLSVSAFGQPADGKGVVTSDGQKLTFTPSDTFRTGEATFTYTVSDGATPVAGTDQGTVTVTVPDAVPVTSPDAATTPYLTAVTVDVLANDLSDSHAPLTVTGVADGAHGSAVVTGTGTATQVRYTPDVTWSGDDVVTYTMTDGTTSVTGTLTVTTSNAPPVAGSFEVTVDGGVPTGIDVLAHASDPNGDHLTVTGIVYAGSGEVGVNGDDVRYDPQAAFRGDETFTYTVSDTKDTSTGTVTVHVRNQAPKPVADSAVVPINGSVTIDVLANDTDPNGDTLTIDSLAQPLHGTAAIVAGRILYTPDGNSGADDQFTYTVDDGQGGQATATVSITAQNGAPVANPDSAIAAGIAGSAVTVDVLANDTDPNQDPLTIDSVAVPLHGTAAIVAGKVVYTPVATYVGQDLFDYTVNDGRGARSTARVTIDVQNLDPVAGNDEFSASTAIPTPLDVLANDTDANGETLSVLSVSATSGHGAVTIAGSTLGYVSANGFVGDDTFSYVVTDPRGGTATGNVIVHVHNANPTAPDRTAHTPTNTPVDVDLLAGVSDPDGQPVVVSATTAPHDGSLTPPRAIVTYTPHTGFCGTDVFTYTVSDGQGGLATRNVVVTVDNADPVAPSYETSTAYDASTDVDVLRDVTDANIPGTSQALTVTAVRLVGGEAGLTWAAGGAATVSPGLGFVGDVLVDYDVSDGAGGTATGRVTVHVAPPAAMAIPDEAITHYLDPVQIDVLANDHSGMGDQVAPILEPDSLTPPIDDGGVTRGSLTAIDGVVTYAPSVGWAGDVTFRYTMRNPLGGTGTATVAVTVGNAIPVAVDDAATTAYDTPTAVDVLKNDTDANIPVTAQKLTVTEVLLTKGSAAVTIDAKDRVKVGPDADYVGDVVVDYVISDGAGGSARATLTVTVGVPRPTADDKTATTPYETPVVVDVLAKASSGQVNVAPKLVPDSLSVPLDTGGVLQGGVTVVDGKARYQPKAGFSGKVVFGYAVSNSFGGTACATVTVTVRPVQAATDPPAAHLGGLAHTGADLDLGGAAGMLLVALGTVGVLFARSRRPGRAG